jgi:hypothetical protein
MKKWSGVPSSGSEVTLLGEKGAIYNIKGFFGCPVCGKGSTWNPKWFYQSFGNIMLTFTALRMTHSCTFQ